MEQILIANTEKLEVRNVKESEAEINNKIYKRLEVLFENEDADQILIYDRNINRKNEYQKKRTGYAKIIIETKPTIKHAKNGQPFSSEKQQFGLMNSFLIKNYFTININI